MGPPSGDRRRFGLGFAGAGRVIRVVIADDQVLVRAGFHMILDGTDDIAVVGEAADGLHALTVVADTRPDVVLMDVRMPGIDGIEATHRSGEPPHVIILTTFDLDEYVYAGLHAGAAGFLLKDTLDGDLLQAVRTVAGGHNVAAPTVTRRLVQHFVATGPRIVDTTPLRGHRQDPREPDPGQARPARPHPRRHLRPPERPGVARGATGAVSTSVGRVAAARTAMRRSCPQGRPAQGRSARCAVGGSFPARGSCPPTPPLGSR
ncbi:hypothetical protein GCM10007977_028720 [Dactylosporangium sucinum]|uniref:Response regulatory domain-containing protein n=1 Tax=Dactylosporangium sucinum TaxID=1424081 RepID=A0A917TKG3_9ACTN|nr:hypothetical protein GCM10007977_028720 [Dactylosporangium sucinum]